MPHNVSDKDSGGGTAIQTRRLTDVEAVVFDLDNTLCYYTLSVEQVFDEALRRARIDPGILGDLSSAAVRYARLWNELQATLESTDRIRLRIIELMLAERGTSDPLCAARLSDAYGVVRDESGVRTFDGVAGLLRDVRRHYALGMLTNGPSDMQWEKIRKLRFGDMFDAIVVAGDVGIYKPDPWVFETLLGRLGVHAHAAVFVGDSYEMDIVGAHRVGMRTAWIRRDGAAPTGEIVPDVELLDVTSLQEVLL